LTLTETTQACGKDPILFGRGSRRYQAELPFAVLNPGTLGHEAMLARDPLLDFLIVTRGWMG